MAKYRVKFWSYVFTDVKAGSEAEAIEKAEEIADNGDLIDSSLDGCIGWGNITAEELKGGKR